MKVFLSISVFLFVVGLALYPLGAAVQKGDVTFKSISVTGSATVGGVDVSKSLLPIGSIVQSVLTTAQFQAQNGTDWVPMEGQSLGSEGSSGKKLCDDYGVCTLPDARNRYLRAAGTSDGDLLASQNDSTAINGLTLSAGGATLTGTTTYVTSVNDHADLTLSDHSNIDIAHGHGFTPPSDHSDIDIAHGHGFTQPSNHSAIDIAHGHGFTQPSNHSDIDIAHPHGFDNPKVPAHYHGFGSGSGMGAIINKNQWNYNQVSHYHFSIANYSNTDGTVNGNINAGAYLAKDRSIPGSSSDVEYNFGKSASSTVDRGRTSSSTIGWDSVNASGTVSGTVGVVTGGCNGNSSVNCQTIGGGPIALPSTPKSISAHTGGAVTALPSTTKSISAHTGGAVTALSSTPKSISAHNFTQNIDAHDENTSSVGISYTSQTINGGDTETRPDTLVVNTFIKIN